MSNPSQSAPAAPSKENFDFSRFSIDDPVLPEPIEEAAFRSGGYPYARKMRRKDYQRQLRQLQIEMVKLQYWVRQQGERLVILFEGRDAAGKGGTIKRFTEFLNPRHAHVVALSKPTRQERGQWYFQRYVAHLPTAGDITCFDRSWYNRAGVERVMGFCTPEQVAQFFREVPDFEALLVRDGIRLFKFWLTVGREMQLKRLHARRHDPLRQWKLSAIDLATIGKWDAYTLARDEMFAATHTEHAPWTVIRANDKRRARLAAMRLVLTAIDYGNKDPDAIGPLDEQIAGSSPAFFTAG